MTAVGLRRYGFDEDFTAIFEALLEAASQFPNYPAAGAVRGVLEDRVPRAPFPTRGPAARWAAGPITYLMKAGLG